MRNYLFSIVTHILLLLLLILLVGVNKKETLEVENAITIDFSDPIYTVGQIEKSSSPAPEQEKKPSPPKVSKSEPERAAFKKTLHTSQKPAEISKEKLQDVSEVVKKVIPPSPPKPDPKEVERERKAEEKAKKVFKFKSLLSKSKEIDHARSSDEKSKSSVYQDSSFKDSSGNGELGTENIINGQLGGRRVIKTPVIKDNSQKKGKVVVKICVNAAGDVISSTYTQIGSTTNDNYLIQLAEEGAKGYKFSVSPVQKECGRIIIDFQLK